MFGQAKEVLKNYFGYEEFREGQKKTIERVLDGENTLCVMPTGGGKSLCYQVPALVFSGTTIVISPLISLMKDQVDTLTQLGISAAYINSSLSGTELQERMQAAREGKYKLLYISPERLESGSFLAQLGNLEIPLIAVDEAHCISQWGHDFRPSYRYISDILNHIHTKPIILALTATATPIVRRDISEALHIDDQNEVVTSFERKNLSFSVIKGQDRDQFLMDYVKKNIHESGIIYAATRKQVDQLHLQLKKAGLKVARYHAGMSDGDRLGEQNDFLLDETPLMVATSAFGMGIDKSNVRYVIHYQMPRNMESYYQEAGRAGRDGLDSACLLLYASHDTQIHRFLIDQGTDPSRMPMEIEKLHQMVGYCHTENCLQSWIVEYFNEASPGPCGRCSNCTDQRETVDVTRDAQMVLSCIIRMGQRYGKAAVAKVLTGSKSKTITQFNFHTLSTYGIMKERSAKDVSDFIDYLVTKDLIGIEHGQFPTIYLTPEGKAVLMGNGTVTRKEEMKAKAISKSDPLFEELRALRKQMADQKKVPPFVIFSDTSLQDMCAQRPSTREEMLKVKGVGKHKQELYGDRFLEVIQTFLQLHPDVNEEKLVVREVIKQDQNSLETEKIPSHITTYELYSEGKLLQEIADERDLSLVTVENHLFKCSDEGMTVDWKSFLSEEETQLIEKAVEEAKSDKLKAIKELLPEDFSYFMIKAYFYLKNINE
ncbi:MULTISPECIES: DNA helicase RecQ [unclassified Bacillus (in: firmicutes)]|uniref:DNA helicase RecQ n=1 Tax=unclassified Bacillus (in: firmicutes) TaxID=185979 RepID=UPI0008E0A434|nr:MULTISPECIES: DNA helicase RecQ [unclassified Bacillus (in: firmicutes)]SFA87696.1 ATP-dependent DNA helicase, RecQ-like [Bacillus sp. UNCCL13]SFQ84365.1 ATP-dependent DNA helicase, RecQ-like [Bacillus sp. cl95]